ncbi:cyclin-O isoform X2 [Chiloscyllium punctatum]|uniref:cyclin-O isoform X2 n=1 Tax=Chiloscyllium punctatum TaxID=137246 RepID=UPI003B6371E0
MVAANATGEEAPLQAAPSPGKRKRWAAAVSEDVTPEDRAEGVPDGAGSRAPLKRLKCPRYRAWSWGSGRRCGLEPSLCARPSEADSDSPALPSCGSPRRLTAHLDLQFLREYGQKCYHLNRESEKKFHPRNCLARQPQVEVYPPRIKQLLSLCCDAFTGDQLRNLECIILIKLNFELLTPSVDFFLEHFTITRIEHEQSRSQAASSERLARRLVELSFADYSFNGYPPSLLASSALLLADRMLHPGGDPSSEISGYPPCLLEDCVQRLKLLVALNEESLAPLEVFEPTDRELSTEF